MTDNSERKKKMLVKKAIQCMAVLLYHGCVHQLFLQSQWGETLALHIFLYINLS